ncbi:hypothetical protein B0H10DRAFT_2025558 [Mycena sp. CBHHK59/15]|nr:hypothetical protein B0H10DRAFT_2025558 [Mycena sp. CBHHK59/15]
MSSSSSSSGTPVPTVSPSQPTASNTNSNLYLFTFLATLLVLVVVSCSIIARSICLRRRTRDRINRAMAEGLVLAPPAQGSYKRCFGAQPQLYDIWLSDSKSQTWSEITASHLHFRIHII